MKVRICFSEFRHETILARKVDFCTLYVLHYVMSGIHTYVYEICKFLNQLTKILINNRRPFSMAQRLILNQSFSAVNIDSQMIALNIPFNFVCLNGI